MGGKLFGARTVRRHREKDGGLQSASDVRYYLEPGVKVRVSYAPGQPEPRVAGPLRVYAETRLVD